MYIDPLIFYLSIYLSIGKSIVHPYSLTLRTLLSNKDNNGSSNNNIVITNGNMYYFKQYNRSIHLSINLIIYLSINLIIYLGKNGIETDAMLNKIPLLLNDR
jgi:hypothetical protein